MKKSLLSITLFCFGILGASAQITITTADVATASKIIYQETDTLPAILVGSPAATSQTWNMSALKTGTKDTLSFLNANWVPNATFPTANLVMKQGYQNNYSYLTNSSTGLFTVGNTANVDFGSGTPAPVVQINSPAEELMIFPATYNSSFTNNYIQTTPPFYINTNFGGYQVDSARGKSEVQKTLIIDAWGSLTTPLGTFNVIRSKETKVTHDTLDGLIQLFGSWYNGAVKSADSTVTYTWWANGVGFPLVTATMDSTGAVKSVQWLVVLPVTGINEVLSSANVTVFPNPAENELNITIDGSKTESVQLFDITGRLMNTYAVENNYVLINTTAFANGIYTYSIIGKENVILNRGKFTIAK